MNKIIYTVCTFNHLPQAKLMLESFLKYNENYTCYIGLVDKNLLTIEDNEFDNFNIIEATSIAIPNIDSMYSNYNALEISCALKSFFAKHLCENTNCNHIIYADTDIVFFNVISTVLDEMQSNSILITPHYYNPPPNDNKTPLERDMLKSGIYNAGFYILKNDAITADFLNWWTIRMEDQCYYNFAQGMGVDQNWFNLIPLYFKNVIISNNKGLNVAYWNLHERTLSYKNNTYLINETDPLLFFHISGYNEKSPEILSKHQNRYTLQKDSVLYNLLIDYSLKISAKKWDSYRSTPYYYQRNIKQKSKFGKFINDLLKPLGYTVIKT